MKCVRDNDDLVFTTVPYESCARNMSSSIGAMYASKENVSIYWKSLPIDGWTDDGYQAIKEVRLNFMFRRAKKVLKNTCSNGKALNKFSDLYKVKNK